MTGGRHPADVLAGRDRPPAKVDAIDLRDHEAPAAGPPR
jgi:hypothetical protein